LGFSGSGLWSIVAWDVHDNKQEITVSSRPLSINTMISEHYYDLKKQITNNQEEKRNILQQQLRQVNKELLVLGA